MEISDPETTAQAVLLSGGLDSAVLLAESLRRHPQVHPLYVRGGLAWEAAELTHLHRFLEAVRCPALQPLCILDLPLADLYGNHWSITGRTVPDASTPDEAVFLPGRNMLLLAKTLVWCHLHQVRILALGVLGSNPFSDATPAFFMAYQHAVNDGIGGRTRVVRPYAGLSKAQVLARGRDLPLELTFSCIQPVAGGHCGVCNKCAERRRAFAEAGLPDATVYDSRDACTA